MMPLAHADRLVELFPDANKLIIDDSWTLIPEEQPKVIAKALRDFIVRPRPATRPFIAEVGREDCAESPLPPQPG